jgi:hypothetical protein
LYGVNDPHYRDFELHAHEALAPLVDGPGAAVEVRVWDEHPEIGGFPTIDCQQAVVAAVADWLDERLIAARA